MQNIAINFYGCEPIEAEFDVDELVFKNNSKCIIDIRNAKSYFCKDILNTYENIDFLYYEIPFYGSIVGVSLEELNFLLTYIGDFHNQSIFNYINNN